jgi:tetratricopeptide (TPR) repeat protein
MGLGLSPPVWAQANPPQAPQSQAPKPEAQRPENKNPQSPLPPNTAKPVPGPGPGATAPPAKKAPPPITVLQPRSPAEREKALSDLYALLATAESETAAKAVETNIERLWGTAASDTISLLMERAMQAIQAKKPELAVKLLDSVVDLAPDYAEGWNRRAYFHFSQNNVQRALGDLRRVLALDPNHFKALDGLAHILKDIGQKKGALAAVKQLLEVHPYWDGAKALHDELSREIEGQAL